MKSMTQTTEQQVLQLLRALPGERAIEILDFAEFLMAREQSPASDIQAALQDSFGVWRDRDDLTGDSAAMVRSMREEWQDREARLGVR